MEIEKLRLEDKGYYTRNLWHIDDVKSKFNCTDEDAQEVLDKALTNEWIMGQIWFSIESAGEELNLETI
jgi:hypothetical protein